MADDQPTGPVIHLMPVEYDAPSSALNLSIPEFGIKPGDQVVWEFFGLPAGWTPWIEFPPGSDFLGPFTALTQSGSAVWGTCRTDQSPTSTGLTYRAAIQKGQGTDWGRAAATVRSNAGSVKIGPADLGTVHRFTVTLEGDVLRVSPILVTVAAGDTVEWDFTNLVADEGTLRPVVEFHQYAGKGEVSDLYFGPFTSLTTAADRVRGMGNNNVTGTYSFRVSVVRAAEGAVLWVSSPDPAIDNRGGVVDPT